MNIKWMWIAYAFCWISVSFAVAVGIYYTKNPNCLWAFLIPACISFSTRDKKV